MIIKGKGRSNGEQLGAYLGDYLRAEKNDNVTLLEINGSTFPDLDRSFRSWEAEAKGTRCKNALWHAQLRTPADEHLTREQQLAAVDILERHLGFQGQPRAIVIHEKEGHEHVHVVWSRIDRQTGKAKRDDFTKKKNVAAAREIEQTLGLQTVASPDFQKSGDRKADREESKKALGQGDFQKAKRTKLDPVERRRTITALWDQTDSGKAFRAALQDAGYVLARGDSRNFVVVDKAGDVHSLARQIQTKGVLKAQVDQRLSDLDPASVPKAEHVRQQLYFAGKDREAEEKPPSSKKAPARTPEGGVIVAPADPKRKPLSVDPADILADITRGRSTFTAADLSYEITRRLEANGHTADDKLLASIVKQVRHHEDFVTLGEDRVGRNRHTSRDMLRTELAMRDNSDLLAGSSLHGVSAAMRDAQPSSKQLGTEQRQALEHATSASDLSLVTGYAGSGKSTMLKAGREAWEAAGYRVRGFALSGMAAQSLHEGSGIESRTLASLFTAMDKLPEQQTRLDELTIRMEAVTGHGFAERKRRFELKVQRDQAAERMRSVQFTSRDVIVLDEAAMVGSRQMNQLLDAAARAKAKVVLVGDAEQLQAIDAGGAFRALTERHGSVKITEIRRQKEDWAKATTKDFGDGYTAEAMDVYRDRGHVHELADRDGARQQIVADWTASRNANRDEKHLMLAFTREDVSTLNKRAREVYQTEKRLGLDTYIKTDTGTKAFARGDRMYFLQNDTRLQVKNGSLGTIESIQEDSLREYHRIKVKLDTGKTVEFNTSDYDKFSHGYAATIHKSQGATAGRAHILASKYMDRHAAYVAMSRHTERVDMYYAKEEFTDFGKLVKSLSRDRRKDTTLDYLGRAEATGQREKFMEKLTNVVHLVTKEEARKRIFERLADSIKLRNDPQSKADRIKRQEAAVAAARLRAILGEHPEQKRERKSSLGRSA
jgi:ATP-dependent exoDNAse (exonuclease V) alpha subunit